MVVPQSREQDYNSCWNFMKPGSQSAPYKTKKFEWPYGHYNLSVSVSLVELEDGGFATKRTTVSSKCNV